MIYLPCFFKFMMTKIVKNLNNRIYTTLCNTVTCRCSVKYEAEEVCGDCPRMCQKSHTERVVVALLLGALIIIFLTLVLSLIYLRETSQQHQYSQTMIYSNNKLPIDNEQRWVSS